MLRQGDTGDWIGTFEGHKGAVWGATLNKDATKAATGAADFSAKIWDAISGDELHSFSHKHIVKCVDFSPDGSHLLTGSNEKLLRIFDINKPEADPLIFSGHTSNIKMSIYLDSNRIISASDDKTVRIWDISNQKEIKSLTYSGSPSSLHLAKSGQMIIVTHGNFVTFYNSETLEMVKEFEVPTPVFSAALHPEKNIFVCGGDDFKMYKIDFDSGAEIESFKGHFGPVHCVRFSPDGELYASGSEDGTLRLWQTEVGKTYGLWKCYNPEDILLNNSDVPGAIKPEA